MLKRPGVSLLEVIACTALVAMLMMPLTGVLRASAKMIREIETEGSAAQEIFSSALALQQYIRDCDSIVKYAEDVVVLLRAGEYVEICIREDQLIARESKSERILAEGIRSLRFEKAFANDAGDIHALTAVLEAVGSNTHAKQEPWTVILAVER